MNTIKYLIAVITFVCSSQVLAVNKPSAPSQPGINVFSRGAPLISFRDLSMDHRQLSYSLPTTPIPLTYRESAPKLDQGIEKIHFFMTYIEARKLGLLTSEMQEILAREFDEAILIFENNPQEIKNASLVKPYVDELKKHIQNAKNNNNLTIPLLHIIALKLSYISDISRMESPENARFFLTRNMLIRHASSIKHLFNISLALFCALFEMNDFGPLMGDYLDKSLEDFLKADFGDFLQPNERYLKKELPLPYISKDGIYGINAYLHQATKGYTLIPYGFFPHPVHGGTVDSFAKKYVSGDGYGLEQETFSSSLLTLNHDLSHFEEQEIYRKQMGLYSHIYNSLMAEWENIDQYILEMIALFYFLHEYILFDQVHSISYRLFSKLLGNYIDRFTFESKVQFALHAHHFDPDEFISKNESLEAIRQEQIFISSDLASMIEQLTTVRLVHFPDAKWKIGKQLAEILDGCLKNSPRFELYQRL